MFKSRVALAATLSATYGIYNGFELLEHDPIPGREEYLDSEKYEIKGAGLEQSRQYQALHSRAQPCPARQCRPATDQQPAFHSSGRRQCHRVRQGVGQSNNSVVVAIALSREAREFWLPLGGIQVGMAGDRRQVAAVENLITGERHPVEWGGAAPAD